MNIGYDELYYALEQSIRLQSHYAELLNMYDGGQRLQFKDIKEWIRRLRLLDNDRNIKKELDRQKKDSDIP